MFTIYYRPPTKLWEGNVFSRVCPTVIHSVHRNEDQLPMMHWTSPHRNHLALPSLLPTWDLTVQVHPPPDMAPDVNWDTPPPRTCSDLFIMKHIYVWQAGSSYLTGYLSYFCGTTLIYIQLHRDSLDNCGNYSILSSLLE